MPLDGQKVRCYGALWKDARVQIGILAKAITFRQTNIGLTSTLTLEELTHTPVICRKMFNRLELAAGTHQQSSSCLPKLLGPFPNA